MCIRDSLILYRQEPVGIFTGPAIDQGQVQLAVSLQLRQHAALLWGNQQCHCGGQLPLIFFGGCLAGIGVISGGGSDTDDLYIFKFGWNNGLALFFEIRSHHGNNISALQLAGQTSGKTLDGDGHGLLASIQIEMCIRDSITADPMFRREDLERWLERKNLPVRWVDGVYDRLASGGPIQNARPLKSLRIWQLKPDTPIEMRFIGLERMAREFDGPNPSQYRIAYDGQAESQELEDIWNKFCRRTLPGGERPLAISDVYKRQVYAPHRRLL